MRDVKAKKALGQHFLTDESIARKIADTISASELPEPLRKDFGSIPIIEIGPGMGVLTKYLLKTDRQLTAIELDSESVRYLAANYPELKVVEGDFLKMNLKDIFPGEFVLIGNYPYNISSQIFFKVLENRERIPVVAGMLQKEVAERICAGPGSKTYGILSVLLQVWYDCEYLFDVEPSVFNPPPKVRSGVLRLTRNSRTTLTVAEEDLKKVVKTAFGQRRKTLRNSLSTLFGDRLSIISPDILSLRPERLNVNQFIGLTELLKK